MQRQRHLDGLAAGLAAVHAGDLPASRKAGRRFRRIASRSACRWRRRPRSSCSTNCCTATLLDRVIIFTYDNASVYQIARRFLVPAITHQTKTRERQQILERFHSGEYNVVVTSQVLNEGVDVPAANVGIILSGTGSVREHVQRLGRLLRKHAATSKRCCTRS